MDEFKLADDAVTAIVRLVVLRHRTAGVLTWKLLNQLESEVLAEAARDNEHSAAVLNMMRSSKFMVYPCDDREASFEGHTLVPVVFSRIIKAWNHVH